MALATALWILVKPFFDWLGGLDWPGYGLKVDLAMYQFFVFILHLVIGLIIFEFAVILTMLVFDLFTFFVLRTEPKKDKRVTIIAAAIISAPVAYYATTSHYAISAINRLASFLLH